MKHPKKTKDEYVTVSELTGYMICPQQALLDKHRGKSRSNKWQELAKVGTTSHKRFERYAARGGKATSDKRCFIATSIYGSDAQETNILRGWRDAHLTGRGGQLFVRAYYRVSPTMVKWINHSVTLQSLTRSALNLIVRNIL